ncbi:hypothetical protein BD410DRAFT_836089 [Rickenella mellea]|uniref:Uncharacterized protein n=1 Tax=Rickenella mellea TaxID=50990 RepID=A0A4Y7QH77_9AGAM|nr:hypothetical protein BD410DRAFT_836089 [Rickenella mellea]
MASTTQSSDTEQTQHRDARDVLGLRLALGSILSPKRTPASRSSSSGTSSPAPFGLGFTHAHAHEAWLLAKEHDHLLIPGSPHPHLMTPGLSSSSVAAAPMTMTRSSSSASVPQDAQHASPHEHADHHQTPYSTVPLPSTAPSPPPAAIATPHGDDHPRKSKAAGYIATLQSKSAWDALIHGSFS